MSKTVTINNVSYPDVPAIKIPLSSGNGYATFTDIDSQTVYSVSKTLTRVTVSNSAANVIGGNGFYAELTPDSGYQISSVTVTMGGVDITESVFSGGIGEKVITSNGIYEADDDNLLAYSRVSVNVSGGSTLGTKSITSNGTYNASSDSLDGYSAVTVNVSAPSPTLQTKSKTYTPTESQQTESVTFDSGYDGIDSVNITVGAISASYVGSGITRRSSSDLSASGDTVSVPSGYYSSSASKAVSSMTLPTSASSTLSGTSKATITPTTSAQYLNIPTGYNGTAQYYTIAAASGGSANIATKTMTNNSNTATSIQFTQLSGQPKAFFARCTTTLSRNSSNRYYYVADMSWDGSATGGVAGNRYYVYNGQYSNVTSGYSYSYSNGTLTLSSTGGQSTSPGAFYNGTYELIYIY